MKNIYQLRYEFEQIGSAMKSKWQRGTKGYSTVDTWSVYNWFEEIIPRILTDYKNNLHGCPAQFTVREDGTEFQNVEEGMEAWKAILERMIFCFTEMNEDQCSMKNEYAEAYHNLFEHEKFWENNQPNKPFEFYKNKNPELEQNYHKREKEIDNYRNKMKDEGFDLFKKYFWNLWD